VYKYFSGEVYLNISLAPEKYYLSDTSPAPEKPGKYLETPFRRRRSIYTHFSGPGEVVIYTYLAPERSEKPDKYLYTPVRTVLSKQFLLAGIRNVLRMYTYLSACTYMYVYIYVCMYLCMFVQYACTLCMYIIIDGAFTKRSDKGAQLKVKTDYL